MTRAQRNRLVEQNLDLVHKIAGSLLRAFPPCFELDDMVQDGAFGLLAAAERYDPSRGVAFRAFAKQRIRGAILDANRRRHYRNATHAPLEDAGDRGAPPGYDERIDAARMASTVDTVLEMLPGRERSVVVRYYGRGATVPQIAKTDGMSPTRVDQVRRGALAIMKRDLEARNIRKAAA